MGNAGQRCFGTGKAFYENYHDHEWGIPSHDDTHLFEMLCLEGAQAGLSWEAILKRREAYRHLFHQFQPRVVAQMSDEELETVLKNPAIIRNRRKVFSTRDNAKIVLKIQEEFGSFDAYLWKFVNQKPIINCFEKIEQVPCYSPISDALSKDLQKRGVAFAGTKIVYSFMQAVGMTNDHLLNCPYRKTEG